MRLAAFAALLALLQEDELKQVTILKQERSTYLPAVNKFKEADKLVDSDPAGCIEKCTEVIDDAKIKDANKEVRIRIQNADGSPGPWTIFIPFQLRGRARLARAEQLGSKARGDAIAMAQDAVKDLEESVRRGANSSKPFIEKAQALIAKLKEADVSKNPRDAKAEPLMKELRALRDPDAILAKCDRIGADIKGSSFEAEFKLIREKAERLKAEQGRAALEKMMTELRAWLKTGPAPAEIVARCDELAPKLAGSPFAGELKLIREKALDDLADARKGEAERAMKDLRAFGDTKPKPDELIRRCDELAPLIKGTPWEGELGLIRDRAVKERDRAKSASEAERAISDLREYVKLRPGADLILKKCDELAPKLEGTSFEGEFKLIRRDAEEERVGAVRRKVTSLCEIGKFRSAIRSVDEEGAFLPDADRRALKDQAEQLCRRFVENRIERFHRNAADLLAGDEPMRALAKAAEADLQEQLAVPAADELVVEHPAIAWCAGFRDAALAARRAPPEPLAAVKEFARHAALAVPLATEGTNRGFATAEGLAFDAARSAVNAWVAGAKTARAGERRGLVEKANDVARALGELSAKVDEALAGLPDRGAAFKQRHEFLAAHVKQIEELLGRFPIDLARIDEIGATLRDPADPKGPCGESPKVALELLEKELLRIQKAEGPRLSKESRQKLGTYLLVAGAYRRLLAGEKVAEIARRDDIREIAKDLAAAGGALPDVVDAFGPKVAKVAELARQ